MSFKVYREPTEDEKRLYYRFYELIFGSHFALAKKRSVMTAALGYEAWSWRVVAITEKAIKAIAHNNFKKPSNVLARDHRHPRAETYNKIFAELMPFEAWWKWVWDNDETILMTNEEHHSQQISKMYAVNPNDNYFVNGDTAGWNHTKGREGAYVKSLCDQFSIAYD